jgi:hypothetical protein
MLRRGYVASASDETKEKQRMRPLEKFIRDGVRILAARTVATGPAPSARIVQDRSFGWALLIATGVLAAVAAARAAAVAVMKAAAGRN